MSTRHDASRIEAQLGHSDPRIRTRALNRLARSSPAERAALQTQAQACEPLLFGTLLELKAGGAPTAATVKDDAVRQLGLALGGRDRRLRRAARSAFVHGNVSLGPARPALARWALDPRIAVRRVVAEVCGETFFGGGLRTPDVDLVERLLADPSLRFTGFEAGCHLLKRALILLTAALATPDRAVLVRRYPRSSRRSVETYALSEAMRKLPALGLELVRALDDGNPGVTAHCARTLGTVTAAVAPSVHELVRALGDREPGVSNEAQRALNELRMHVVLLGPPLLELCRSRRPHVRANATRCLGFARIERLTMWEAFERALDDEASEVRAAAVETLRHTARDIPDGVMARLVRFAGPRSPSHLRMNAAHTLAHFAADPRPALAALRCGRRARAADTRRAATEALDCLARNVRVGRPARARRGRARRRRTARR